MKKYFYHDGQQQRGPFNLDELKREPITICGSRENYII